MNDKEQIIDLYRQENTAIVEKDLVTLNKILSENMTLSHMTGYVQPKMEWIDQIQNDEMQYFSSKEENIKDAKIDGNHASLVGQKPSKSSNLGRWSQCLATSNENVLQ